MDAFKRNKKYDVSSSFELKEIVDKISDHGQQCVLCSFDVKPLIICTPGMLCILINKNWNLIIESTGIKSKPNVTRMDIKGAYNTYGLLFVGNFSGIFMNHVLDMILNNLGVD